MYSRLLRLIPAPVRRRVRRNRAWRAFYDHRHARDLALSSKRLDLCSAQFAHLLHLAGTPSLQEKVCLEIGCGWVLTHTLVCHLLGAKTVIASDIESLFRPSVLPAAIDVATHYIVRDVLSPFCRHDEIRERLDHLTASDTLTETSLRRLGIRYVAPIDLAIEPLGEPVDFVYSLSVLEHAHQDQLMPLLSNLAAGLTPGGMMIHAIHLEDHRDIDGDPFAFLGEPGRNYGRAEEAERGNRLRRSQWERLFRSVKGVDTTFLYEFSRLDKPLPAKIDASVEHVDEADLRVSHIGVKLTKRPD